MSGKAQHPTTCLGSWSRVGQVYPRRVGWFSLGRVAPLWTGVLEAREASVIHVL